MVLWFQEEAQFFIKATGHHSGQHVSPPNVFSIHWGGFERTQVQEGAAGKYY